jgi:hypothetical protein
VQRAQHDERSGKAWVGARSPGAHLNGAARTRPRNEARAAPGR